MSSEDENWSQLKKQSLPRNNLVVAQSQGNRELIDKYSSKITNYIQTLENYQNIEKELSNLLDTIVDDMIQFKGECSQIDDYQQLYKKKELYKSILEKIDNCLTNTEDLSEAINSDLKNVETVFKNLQSEAKIGKGFKPNRERLDSFQPLFQELRRIKTKLEVLIEKSIPEDLERCKKIKKTLERVWINMRTNLKTTISQRIYGQFNEYNTTISKAFEGLQLTDNNNNNVTMINNFYQLIHEVNAEINDFVGQLTELDDVNKNNHINVGIDGYIKSIDEIMDEYIKVFENTKLELEDRLINKIKEEGKVIIQRLKNIGKLIETYNRIPYPEKSYREILDEIRRMLGGLLGDINYNSNSNTFNSNTFRVTSNGSSSGYNPNNNFEYNSVYGSNNGFSHSNPISKSFSRSSSINRVNDELKQLNNHEEIGYKPNTSRANEFTIQPEEPQGNKKLINMNFTPKPKPKKSRLNNSLNVGPISNLFGKPTKANKNKSKNSTLNNSLNGTSLSNLFGVPEPTKANKNNSKQSKLNNSKNASLIKNNSLSEPKTNGISNQTSRRSLRPMGKLFPTSETTPKIEPETPKTNISAQTENTSVPGWKKNLKNKLKKIKNDRDKSNTYKKLHNNLLAQINASGDQNITKDLIKNMKSKINTQIPNVDDGKSEFPIVPPYKSALRSELNKLLKNIPNNKSKTNLLVNSKKNLPVSSNTNSPINSKKNSSPAKKGIGMSTQNLIGDMPKGFARW
jgi:hypothetical protein